MQPAIDVFADDHIPETDAELQLAEAIAEYYDDPLGFVEFAFPWGEEGTFLEEYPDGPDKWQREFLTLLGELIQKDWNETPEGEKVIEKAIRMAVASGHGIGKTAMTSWIILWFISTRPNPQIVVTANTKNQLTTKTWRELAKWHGCCICGHWFNYTATQLKHKQRPDTWFATAVPWSAANSSAFAGTHEAHVLMLFDEASEIDASIWETAEGAMTTPGAMWLCFGNPTSNTGRFRQCWTLLRKRWHTFRVDSREAKMADNEQLRQWIEDWGIDSDFVRVRILGKFPKSGSKQLIPNDRVEDAQEREIEDKTIPANLPKLMGIDVGSYGDAQTVALIRQGPKVFNDIRRWREADVNKLSGYLAEFINEANPDCIFIDANGYGHAVFLQLVQLGFNVTPVYAGDRKAVLDTKTFYNPRMEMWWRMREWLKSADIPQDNELFEDLIGPEYGYDNNMIMRLERKEEMAKRGLPSPDAADALGFTFAQPVPIKEDQSIYESIENLEPECV